MQRILTAETRNPPARLAVGALATLFLTGAAQAAPVTLLNDTFADLDRTNQDLPTSAAWYYGSSNSGRSASAASGALALTGGNASTTVGTTAYFAAVAQSLAVGDTIQLSFDFSFAGSTSQGDGFRFGLYNSGGSRVTTDVTTNNAADVAYDQWGGYTIETPVNLAANATGHVLRLRRRDTAASGSAETPIGASQNVSKATASVAGGQSAVAANWYANNILSVTRTSATGVQVAATVAGTTVSWSDPGGYTAFDAIHFWFHGSLAPSSGAPAQLDNILVTYTAVPEAAGAAVLAAAVPALARRRRARE